MGYRPEIDGLRGIAVLGVVLFHLGFTSFSGGYVGVDVFFVISGYLITRLIRGDLQNGRFTFRGFYIRRARRLLPALFFTLAISLAAACLLLSAGHLENFAKSLAAAAISLSNVLFWKESGYFDLQSSVKPLLHTWSLGVEEQFYLFWPLLLVLSLRRSDRLTIAVVCAGGLVSFTFNLIHAGHNPATMFYLLPFRVFEFAIGALMVWADEHRPEGAALEGIAAIGLALIVWSMLSYTPDTVFPTYNALVPCVGTAFVVYAGDARHVGLLLRNRVAVAIGLISYSLYLIHWPLIVFYRYYTLTPLGFGEQMSLMTVSFIAAAAMYRFIEQPFRRRYAPLVPQWRFVTACVGLSTASFLLGALLVANGGWPARIPSYRLLPTSVEFEKQELSYCGGYDRSSDLVTCMVDRASEKDIYVLGDSHARHLVPGFAKAFPTYNIKVMYYTGCFPHRGLDGYFYDLGSEELNSGCLKRNSAAIRFFEHADPTNVFLSFWTIERDFSSNYVAGLKSLVNLISARGHNVKVIGDSIRPGIYVADCFAVPPTISDQREQTRCIGDQRLGHRLEEQNDKLDRLLGAGVYINVNKLFCGAGNICINNIAGQPLFRDTNHLTPFGSEYLIGHIVPMLKVQ